MTATTGLALVTGRIAPIADDGPLLLLDDEPTTEALERIDFDSVEFYVPSYTVGPGTLGLMSRMPRLQVCQLLTAGYEHALPYAPDGVTLCNAVGVHDSSTAELAVGLMIACLRGLDDAARDMQRGEWNPLHRPALADRTVVVVGAGGIGRAIEARLAPFETSVTLVGQSAREGVAGNDSLDALLPAADIVVLAVPLTSSTRHLVDSAFLERMHDGALLVNVSRGAVVDTDALVAATSSGRIRAALDVTDPEPLPSDHPLWHCPGVLITPHVGGNSGAFEPRARRLVERQLARWRAGEPLHHIVRGG